MNSAQSYDVCTLPHNQYTFKNKRRGYLKSIYNPICQVELVETDIDYQ